MQKPLALIIEDDRDISAMFRHVLDVAGYQTEIVLDGMDAKNILLTIQPDIVLLDLQLPRLSGVEILQMMRADERLSTVPVVVITAHAYYSDSLPVEPDLLLLKPVDVEQLSRLAQRLKVTQGAMHDAPQDKVTHLYTFPFFTVRMSFALERVKQLEQYQFGVLFADLISFEEFQKKLKEEDYNHFVRNMADQFKSTLRPTDTIACWENGCFLSLIEEVRNPNVPLKIAGRVLDILGNFLEKNKQAHDLQLNLGVLLCGPDYENVEQIVDDISFARGILHATPLTSPAIYDRDILLTKRGL